MYFPLIHQELTKTVRAGSQPLFFVSVSRRADITAQKGDKANKLKGDTKRKELSYFFLLSLTSTKTIILNEIKHGDKSYFGTYRCKV